MMKFEVRNFLGAMSVAILMIIVSPQANASMGFQGGLYTFSQTGFSGGGVITGSFYGLDFDHDGRITGGFDSTLNSEILNFDLSFSGDSFVENFSHTLSDLGALIYNFNIDGLGFHEKSLIILSGDDRLYYFGDDYYGSSSVYDYVLNKASRTQEPLVASPVPENETWAMLITGLLLVSLKVKRKNA